MGGFVGRKGKRETLCIYYNPSKININIDFERKKNKQIQNSLCNSKFSLYRDACQQWMEPDAEIHNQAPGRALESNHKERGGNI